MFKYCPFNSSLVNGKYCFVRRNWLDGRYPACFFFGGEDCLLPCRHYWEQQKDHKAASLCPRSPSSLLVHCHWLVEPYRLPKNAHTNPKKPPKNPPQITFQGVAQRGQMVVGIFLCQWFWWILQQPVRPWQGAGWTFQKTLAGSLSTENSEAFCDLLVFLFKPAAAKEKEQVWKWRWCSMAKEENAWRTLTGNQLPSHPVNKLSLYLW